MAKKKYQYMLHQTLVAQTMRSYRVCRSPGWLGGSSIIREEGQHSSLYNDLYKRSWAMNLAHDRASSL